MKNIENTVSQFFGLGTQKHWITIDYCEKKKFSLDILGDVSSDIYEHGELIVFG